ncbi:MAG: 4-hydroxythreonine-4-phosphate dehydrogenase PdxA [candidate division KSB1 bacterium]|nr:4-hydroxythreonine-4-phosphate dehydrogenase PdxA [candidate division KSB1 bacterium]MDQ7065480.1 4-hydroxythreonine-4-phosphate dehydrogenase PdxA [candidate division KSB1 bacterium]
MPKVEQPIRIAITIGDINGIGPEVILRALQHPQPERRQVVVVDPPGALKWWAERLGFVWPDWPALTYDANLDALASPVVVLVDAEFSQPQLDVGRPTSDSGQVAAHAIETAVRLALNGRVHAVVTAPIAKSALKLAGLDYPGHTEFLAHLCGVPHPVMLLLAGTVRVAVATRHIPLRQVPDALSVEHLLQTLQVLNEDLRQRFGMAQPRIAVTGLNPHAGEQGTFGREEIQIIAPAIEAARRQHIEAVGPFPADALFARLLPKQRFDAVLAMYHDQGLIPLKMLARGAGVNYTCGLPIIRTSPDHGTAFDIAGKNQADESSMMEAIDLAMELAQT